MTIKDKTQEKRVEAAKNGYDFDARIVEINEVDEYDSKELCRVISQLDKISNEPITVIINSPGGCVYNGLALYDTIRGCKSPVHTFCRGMAMSMGLILFVAGDTRSASPNARFMGHSVSSFSMGTVRDQEVDLEESKFLNTTLLNILAERTSKTKQWWARHLKHEDRYFSTTEAKKLGVI